MPKKALAGCSISLFGRNPNWDHTQQSKVGGWLGNLSGKLSSFSSSTTHLVVSKKRWTENPKPTILQQALDDKAKNERDLKIVSFDWLEDCLNSQSRKREVPYEWEKRDTDAARLAAKGKKAAEKDKAAKSAAGLMSEVFHESTDQYVDPLEKQKLDAKLERDRARERQEKEGAIRKRKEQMSLFGQGARKAKKVLLTDNYHVYQDTTGFKYDITVTKVEPRLNKNERWELMLKVFESNDNPPTYAMGVQFKGTNSAGHNSIIAAIGSNYFTAMHAFKAEFSARTGMDWDARISHHVKRIHEEKLARGVATSAAPGCVKGTPISDSDTREAFAAKKFEYHPPAYGPKGEITDAEIARCKELGVTLTHAQAEKGPAATPAAALPIEDTAESNQREAIESWMGNQEFGTGEVQQQKRVDSPAAMQDSELDALLNGEDYPFEKPLPSFDLGIEQGGELSDAAAAIQEGNGTSEGQHAALAPEIDQAQPANGEGEEFSYLTDDMPFGPADAAWLEKELAQFQPQEQTSLPADSQHHVSMEAQIPSFTTHPTTTDTSFQHGTQDIGETQVAEKAGGEFLEDFAGPGIADHQQSTLPDPTKKEAEKPKGLFAGLNLRSSILGKRKADAEGQGAAKIAKIGEGGQS